MRLQTVRIEPQRLVEIGVPAAPGSDIKRPSFFLDIFQQADNRIVSGKSNARLLQCLFHAIRPEVVLSDILDRLVEPQPAIRIEQPAVVAPHDRATLASTDT